MCCNNTNSIVLSQDNIWLDPDASRDPQASEKVDEDSIIKLLIYIGVNGLYNQVNTQSAS